MTQPKLKLRLTYAAGEDMDQILYYTAKRWDQDQADRYENVLWSAMLDLLDYPESSSLVISKFPGYRRRIVQHHVIYYQVQGSDVIVERILHERQRTEGQFDDLD